MVAFGRRFLATFLPLTGIVAPVSVQAQTVAGQQDANGASISITDPVSVTITTNTIGTAGYSLWARNGGIIDANTPSLDVLANSSSALVVESGGRIDLGSETTTTSLSSLGGRSGRGYLVDGANSSLSLNNVTTTFTSSSVSQGMLISNSGHVSITNGSFDLTNTTSGRVTFSGMAVTSGSSLILDNTTISGRTEASKGVARGILSVSGTGSSVTGDGLILRFRKSDTSSFNGSSLMQISGGATVDLTNISISDENTAMSGVIGTNNTVTTLTNGDITSGTQVVNANGIGARLTANNIIMTSTRSGTAVGSYNGGELYLNGGTLTTRAFNTTGVAAQAAGSKVFINGTDIYLQEGGTAQSYALYSYGAGSLISTENATIVAGVNTNANLIGAYATSGGHIDISDNSRITVNGPTGNVSQRRAGLWAAGTATQITASNSAINTTGTAVDGARTDTGNYIDLSGTSVTTTGNNSHGLFVNGVDARISGSSGTVISTVGAMSSGIQLLDGGIVDLTDTDVSAAGMLASGLSVYGVGNSVSLTDSTLSSAQGSAISVQDGITDIIASNSNIYGPVLMDVSGSGTLTTVANDVSVLTGQILTAQSGVNLLYLNTGSTWIPTGPSSLTALGLDGGAIRYDTTAQLLVADSVTLGTNGGVIDTNGYDNDFLPTVLGSGGLVKAGSGALNLEGSNAYGGATTVTGGALYVNGDQSAAAGETDVGTGATLGGVGMIGGDVTIQNGGTLAPGRTGAVPGALTINGNLALSGGSALEYSFGQANVVGGALNDLTTVHGNLTLDGTINVVATPGGSFDPGIYRVISYDGTLTDNGLAVGSIPASGYYVQTAIANQVNLVNTSGLNLNYWDVWPASNGAVGNGSVNGGTGTWQSSGSGGANINWTESTGAINAPYQDDAFAIFMATGGTVTVDNNVGAVRAAGMQFASDGYVITGDQITLVGAPSSIIRVGDGTAAGSGYTATIGSALTGNTQLTKTDLGTLVLQGNNSYTGGTAINGGVLQVASNTNLGDAAGGVSFNGGTLRTTADFTIDRVTVLEAGGGIIETVGATTLGYDGVINGDGGLTKIGTGTLVLNGDNTYAGGTAINGGTVQISSDAKLGAASGPLGIDGGTLHSTGNISMKRATTIGAGNATIETDAGTTLTQQGNMAGAGALTKTGDGALVLTDTGSYTGNTTIASGLLQLGNGGTSGSIVGDVSNNSTLAFNRSDAFVFDGVISGTGNVRQIGPGVTVLNKQSAYSGTTSVEAGTLAAGGVNYFSSNSGFTVTPTGTLALNDFNQSTKSLSNSGIVDLGPEAGTTLIVTDDHTGNGGTIRIGTALGNDSSVTDRLIVNGNTSGTGILAVKNVNGSGAQTNEGIKIVDIAGASNATFTLLGDYEFQGAPAVVGGAYAYQLYKDGKANPNDGDWYLRSQLIQPPEPEPGPDPGPEPLYQPGVPGYEAYPQFLLGLNGLPTSQQRVGNRYWSNAGNIMLAEGADPVGSPYAPAEEAGNLIESNGVWGRIAGAHTRADPRFSSSGTDYSFNTLKLQAGLDGILAETENGKLIGGITVHYTHGKAKTRSVYGDVQISTDGYGLGGTLTWYGDNGFYLDGQAQVAWYDSDLMSDLANMGLAGGNNGFGYAVSAESGKRVAIDQSWSVTPQAQLTYSNVDFDSFNDTFGARISLDRGESLQGRIGLAVEHQNSWYNANGLIDRTYLYGIADVYYEFLDGTRVDVSGTSFASKNERLWGGIGLGGSYNWNGDKYSIYGEGSVNTSLEKFADSYSYKGTLGFRVYF